LCGFKTVNKSSKIAVLYRKEKTQPIMFKKVGRLSVLDLIIYVME
jgi:hypothetical protein